MKFETNGTWTFENDMKTSRYAHEHVTLSFQNGIISVLGRDKVRSVSSVWSQVGTYGRLGVEFTTRCAAFDLVATHLKRIGFMVWFDSGKFANSVPVYATIDDSWGTVNVLRCVGRITNPDSLRGNVRRRSCELGRPPKSESALFGRKLTLTPEQRAAAAAQLKRSIERDRKRAAR